MTALETLIAATKIEKAAKLFDANAPVYGSEAAYLKSLDCRTKAEAVKMLAEVQKVSIRKVDGVVRVF